MRSPNLSASLLLGTALAIGACGDDSSATTASAGNGSGGEGGSSSSTKSTGPGQGGDGDPTSSTASSSPTTSTQSGGGDGGAPSGPGGTGGTTTSVVGGGDPGSGGNTGSGGDGGGGGPLPCAAGVIQCDGTVQQVCDGNGGFTDVVECAPGGCIPGVGCTVCTPGTASCNGNVSSICKGDGSGYDVYSCDPVQGSVCDPDTGHCTGTCSPEILGNSYIGCDYFPTVTANIVAPNFSFAVAVANTSDQSADITITRGAVSVANATVGPDSVQVIALPWVTELKDANGSLMATDGAYRLRTTQPVTVYQYSPLEYTTGGGNSFTNDASLLLPTNAWTGNYRVAARNSWTFSGSQPYPGFYAITASADNTTVTVTPSATGTSIIAGGGIAGNGTGTIVMNEGDVLQVMSTVVGNPDPNDVTGTLVTADRPVQVIGGSKCTFIPHNIGYCDHLEESMPPIETLATEYIITPPLIPTGGNTPKAQMVRVIATEPNTTVVYDPPQAGAPTMLTNPGDYFEISQTAADFVITADKAVLVSQYMLGQDAGGGSGDPAMALAVATEQYRNEYLFHAPTNYDTNYLNVTAPDGAVIMLDGVQVNGFVSIGASGYGVARVALPDNGDGNHYITSVAEFGISVYGYGQYTSYWYPGGLDLDRVN